MAKSGKKKKSAPIVKVRLRGCPDEQSFIEHVLDRFTIGGLRLRTKADPAIGSKLRVVYQLEDGETVFHALCLVAGTSPPRDGKRTLDLRFRRMGRSSKDIYDAILEAQKLRVRGDETDDSGEDQGRADQPTPRDVSTVSSEEEDASADAGRGQLPTPVSGVRAVPDRQEESGAEPDEEAPDDATPAEGIDRQAEAQGSVEDVEPPKKKRLSSELTTEEVLQLEDDEILDVDEDEQDDEESAATAEVVAESAQDDESGEGSERITEDDDADEDDIAAADIIDEDEDADEIAAAEIVDEEDEDDDAETEAEDGDSVAAKAEEHTDEVPTADIVAEDEEEPAAEIAAQSSEDEPPTADIVEEDEDDDLMEAEVFDDEDLIDEETLDVEELDDDLEQSFDEMFDDLGDMLFSDEEEKKDLHQAPTEETDTVYTQPPPGPPATEGEKKEDDEAYDILKDAFEFASSDSTPEKEKPRDGSRLRLASASYQAVPEETAEDDDAEDEAPEVVEEEKIGSRPSDAYDIVKDAFEFASSDSEPTESKERDASTLRLASAAYQAVPDEAVDREGEEEDTRTSEEQEREALEALARQKERSGPRPIVGPAVRKKKKGFFERLFNNDE